MVSKRCTRHPHRRTTHSFRFATKLISKILMAITLMRIWRAKLNSYCCFADQVWWRMGLANNKTKKTENEIGLINFNAQIFYVRELDGEKAERIGLTSTSTSSVPKCQGGHWPQWQRRGKRTQRHRKHALTSPPCMLLYINWIYSNEWANEWMTSTKSWSN